MRQLNKRFLLYQLLVFRKLLQDFNLVTHFLSLIVISLLLILPNRVHGQQIKLESVTPYGCYFHHLSLKSGKKLNLINGFGSGASIRFRMNKFLAMGIECAYNNLKIDQDDAVEQWNWKFWEKFYGAYIHDLQKSDSNYVAVLKPFQRISIIPVHLAVVARFPNKTFFTPELNMAVGVYFYKRNLWLSEQWQKNFPDLNYTYEYGFNNYAEVHRGRVYGARVGLGGYIALSKYIKLNLMGKYHHIIQIGREENYDDFPMDSFIEFSTGVSFFY